MTISEIIQDLTALANRVEYGKQFNTVKEVAKAINELRMRIEVDRLPTEFDLVNHPSHYTQGNIECIDAMQAAYGKESVMHFCKCNAFKYQWRFDKKNGEEDIKKAQWYQNKFLELQRELKYDTK